MTCPNLNGMAGAQRHIRWDVWEICFLLILLEKFPQASEVDPVEGVLLLLVVRRHLFSYEFNAVLSILLLQHRVNAKIDSMARSKGVMIQSVAFCTR